MCGFWYCNKYLVENESLWLWSVPLKRSHSSSSREWTHVYLYGYATIPAPCFSGYVKELWSRSLMLYIYPTIIGFLRLSSTWHVHTTANMRTSGRTFFYRTHRQK